MSKKRNILIGGAWPYANSTLHVGHLSALLGGDVLARYFRLKGDNVVYVSGSDCHGTPITLRAHKEDTTPKAISDLYHQNFVEIFNKMDFSYSMYGKTSEKYHKKEVQEILLTLIDNGYIYEKEDKQIYCLKEKKFLSDREITFICPECGKSAKGDGCDCGYAHTFDDLLKGKCALCFGDLTSKKDKNLYFKLSAFQNQIQEYLNLNEKRWRVNAVNETRKYLNQGLIDRAITRNLDWGVDVPIKGYENKKIYVWIEAVIGYVSTCKKYCTDNNLNFEDFLLNDKCDLLYMVHGKDNIIFHSIIFPAILLGLNKNYKLPTDIVSSEFLTLNGDKISKSAGNYQETSEILDLGCSDTLRFYMIGYGPEKKDSDFTLKDYTVIHNNEIVNKFGNFINRTLKFKGIEKIVKSDLDDKVKIQTINTYNLVGEKIQTCEFKEACRLAMLYVEFANKYYDENKPWELFKTNLDEFNRVMYNCATMILNMANIFEPFMPHSSKTIARMLDLGPLSWSLCIIDQDIVLNHVEALFERIIL